MIREGMEGEEEALGALHQPVPQVRPWLWVQGCVGPAAVSDGVGAACLG